MTDIHVCAKNLYVSFIFKSYENLS